MKDGLSRFKEKASRSLHVCEEKSRDLVTSFMGLFGRDGRIVSRWWSYEYYWYVFIQSEFFHNTSQQVKNVFTRVPSPEDDESVSSGSSGYNSPINSNITT